MEASPENAQADFQMPLELQRPPPRTVRRRPGTSGCSVIFARLFILPHMIIGLVLLCMVPITIAMLFFGHEYEGRAISKYTTSGKRTHYHVRYAYDADGIHRTGERFCSWLEYNNLIAPSKAQPPSTIQIRALDLLGHHFDHAMMSDESPWREVGFTILIALFWNGFLSIFVYLLWIAPWQEKRLYRLGALVPGRLLGKHTRSGKSISHYLDYEFIHPHFGLLRKQQSVHSKGYYHAHQHQMVTVLCYLHKKRPTVVYEFGNFECV